VIEASKNMGSDFEAEYLPESDKIEDYKLLMDSYSELSAFIESVN
jgi:L-ribulokinase